MKNNTEAVVTRLAREGEKSLMLCLFMAFLFQFNINIKYGSVLKELITSNLLQSANFYSEALQSKQWVTLGRKKAGFRQEGKQSSKPKLYLQESNVEHMYLNQNKF